MGYINILILITLLFLLLLTCDLLLKKYVANLNENAYKKVYNNNHKIVKINRYNEITIPSFIETPIVFDKTNTLSKRRFIELFKDYNLDYGKSGNSNLKKGTMKLSTFLSKMKNKRYEFYIFHYVKNNSELIQTVTSYIPAPNAYFINSDDLNIVISVGSLNSGTHLHNHGPNVNFLICGKKLWVVFPNSSHNSSYLKRIYAKYGQIEEDTKEWFDKNGMNLINNIKNIFIFVQYAGQAVYIPDQYYHMVINLDNSYSIIYNEPHDENEPHNEYE